MRSQAHLVLVLEEMLFILPLIFLNFILFIYPGWQRIWGAIFKSFWTGTEWRSLLSCLLRAWNPCGGSAGISGSRLPSTQGSCKRKVCFDNGVFCDHLGSKKLKTSCRSLQTRTCTVFPHCAFSSAATCFLSNWKPFRTSSSFRGQYTCIQTKALQNNCSLSNWFYYNNY